MSEQPEAGIARTPDRRRRAMLAFAGDPNFRDLFRSHLPLFANALFLGGSF